MLKLSYKYGDGMKNNLYEELYDLQKREDDLKRNLDIQYIDKERRTYYFNAIQKTKEQIEKIKFKIKMKERLNNGKK